jgi:hypothetical protein
MLFSLPVAGKPRKGAYRASPGEKEIFTAKSKKAKNFLLQTSVFFPFLFYSFALASLRLSNDFFPKYAALRACSKSHL